MLISIVVAISENFAIGKDNQLLWKLSNDLKHFKTLTTGHHILMGKKTFESIGRPLPNRTNLVLSKQEGFQIENCFTFTTIDKAVDFAKQNGESELFVIGGGKVYETILPHADKLYVTHVKGVFEADTFFPNIDASIWKKINQRIELAGSIQSFDCEFAEYVRI